MYVYGVLRAGERPRLPEIGIEGMPVGCLEHGRLAAIVTDAVEEPVRPRRRNVMAHSHVLQEAVASAVDVLPMQFGVVLPSAGAVREELLAAHAPVLLGQLDEYAGLVELDVTVSCPEQELLVGLLSADPALREARRALGTGSYQDRIALGETVARAIDAERDRITAWVVDALAPEAVDVMISEPQHEDMHANVAFLVSRGRTGAFLAAAGRLGGGLAPAMSVRCLGPLPPYRFVDVALGEEVATWA